MEISDQEEPKLSNLMSVLQGINEKLDDLTEKYNELTKINEKLQVEINDLRKQFSSIQSENNQIEQRKLKNIIVVTGFPICATQRPEGAFMKVMKHMKLMEKISPNDFTCKPLINPTKKPPTKYVAIRVEFNQESSKSDLLNATNINKRTWL
ncbi:hypothetical protein HHI36_008477 [Cryptolaemus montrouzieri]|uniref:Uncharacterized protein n=1 Tax=Cryptolaemus montrouzieri TaxID=559131 RepID=A0ABD2MT47_9CUCU